MWSISVLLSPYCGPLAPEGSQMGPNLAHSARNNRPIETAVYNIICYHHSSHSCGQGDGGTDPRIDQCTHTIKPPRDLFRPKTHPAEALSSLFWQVSWRSTQPRLASTDEAVCRLHLRLHALIRVVPYASSILCFSQ